MHKASGPFHRDRLPARIVATHSLRVCCRDARKFQVLHRIL